MNEKLYSIKDAAEKTGKAMVTVRMLVRTHGLGRKIGNAYYVLTEDDIQKLMEIPKAGRPKGSVKKKK
jgi:hypothetical protein